MMNHVKERTPSPNILVSAEEDHVSTIAITANSITMNRCRWNWTLPNDARKINHSRVSSKVTETARSAMHVANRVTSREIVVQRG